MSMNSPRLALDPPPEAVVCVSTAHMKQATQAARDSARARVILPFHKSHEDPLHRMLNAMQPATYVQPHRHLTVPKAEVFLVLQGAIDFLVFDDVGKITHALALRAGTAEFGIDLASGLFHTFLVRAEDTVLYEIKCGPYTGLNDKDFADFAPAEGSSQVPVYLRNLEHDLLAFRERTL